MRHKGRKKKEKFYLPGHFIAAAAGKYLLLDFIAAILFYDSIGLFVLLLPLFLIYMQYEKKALIQKQQREHKLQFREAMTAMYHMIAAGYSLESAIRGVPEAVQLCCGEDSWIVQSFLKMLEALKMNVPAQKCLEDFACESRDDDIISFYEIICIAKKYGGSMSVVVKMAIDKISRRIETEYEMMTMLAGRKNEFTVMTLIPACIILYMRLCSPELMSVLYSNIAGRAVMTVCLGLYAAAALLGWSMTKKAMAAI